jgi:hypothetical protein
LGILAVAAIIAIGEAAFELSIGHRAKARIRGDTGAMLEVVILIQAMVRKWRGADRRRLQMMGRSNVVRVIIHDVRLGLDVIFDCMGPPVRRSEAPMGVRQPLDT